MAKTDTLRVAVLGAGPIGLEAALRARTLGWPVVIYERGRVGGHLRRWGPVRLFSPFSMNVTPEGRAAIKGVNPQHNFPADNDCILARDHVALYLEPLAQTPLLRDCLRLDAQVLAIGRRGFLKEESDSRRGQQPFR